MKPKANITPGVFLKKHKILSVVLLLLPSLLLIFSIFGFELTKSDIANLLGGFAAYYGTVILAIVTVAQNDNLMELSSRTAEIQEIDLSSNNHPEVVFDYISSTIDDKLPMLWAVGELSSPKEDPDTNYDICFNGYVKSESNYILLFFKNIGNAPAYSIQAYDYGPTYSATKKHGILGYRESYIVNELEEDGDFYLRYHVNNDETILIRSNICYKNKYKHSYYNSLFVKLWHNDGVLYYKIAVGEQIMDKSSVNPKIMNYEED